MSVEIRMADRDDCLAIAGLHYLSHTTSFRAFAQPEWISARRADEYRTFWCDYLQDQPAPDRTWVARSRRVVVGTVTIMSLANSSEHFAPTGRNYESLDEVACLRLMYVHPEFQRRRIGSQLMAQAMKFMNNRGYRMATLITHAENRTARQFYEHAGWQLDTIFEGQVEEFHEDPPGMRRRARYFISLEE
ncbi:MAG: GNAT family N-acetyltransferase [Anaerolineales bacterium]|jgi:GNAT superfamily N-acetyltransferase